MNNPAVVVVAYNRPDSLLRLLHSLEQATYPDRQVPLVISLDGGASAEVLDVANKFNWTNGLKRIIQKDHNLGLRQHIMHCGQLTKEYGSVILLEDDLMVGPHYYSFALSAVEQSATDEHVAGISLFSYLTKEFKHLPFIPLQDGYDNYYLQVPSSWGQVWTDKWWMQFEDWLAKGKGKNTRIPTPVATWSDDRSWKKDFIYYLVEKSRYFFYPRVSHSTNFGEAGAHHQGKFARYQVPLQMGNRPYQFSSFQESKAIYDVFFEWVGLNEEGYEGLEFDLYGEKPGFDPETKYVLTTRNVKKVLKKYAATMLPLEANYWHQIEGEGLNLAKKEDVDLTKSPMNPIVHERLVGKYSKQRYWKQYIRILKENWGL